MKLHYLCLLFLNILLIEAVEVSENELEVELKENAENVCIDQEVQNKILNITYIQSIVSNFPIFLWLIPFSHYSKSQIFVQKFNFDKTLQFSREIKVVNN